MPRDEHLEIICNAAYDAAYAAAQRKYQASQQAKGHRPVVEGLGQEETPPQSSSYPQFYQLDHLNHPFPQMFECPWFQPAPGENPGFRRVIWQQQAYWKLPEIHHVACYDMVPEDYPQQPVWYNPREVQQQAVYQSQGQIQQQWNGQETAVPQQQNVHPQESQQQRFPGTHTQHGHAGYQIQGYWQQHLNQQQTGSRYTVQQRTCVPQHYFHQQFPEQQHFQGSHRRQLTHSRRRARDWKAGNNRLQPTPDKSLSLHASVKPIPGTETMTARDWRQLTLDHLEIEWRKAKIDFEEDDLFLPIKLEKIGREMLELYNEDKEFKTEEPLKWAFVVSIRAESDACDEIARKITERTRRGSFSVLPTPEEKGIVRRASFSS